MCAHVRGTQQDDEEVAMRVLVVYESMYGNTHLIADAVAGGMTADVTVVAVGQATAALIDGADLLVVGGPTHVHGMTRASTRRSAWNAALEPDKELTVDADAAGVGLREWFDGLSGLTGRAAAFDTRMDGPTPFTGRASKGIAKRLRHHGAALVVEPESFLVTKDNHLLPDEAARARAWGAQLQAALRSGPLPTAR
jgi:hypothetical protein